MPQTSAVFNGIFRGSPLTPSANALKQDSTAPAKGKSVKLLDTKGEKSVNLMFFLGV